MSTPMTRDEALRIVSEARQVGERPDLRRANLSWANLRWDNLSEADMSGANLREADMRWANLSWADMHGANLREADMRWANLSWANLSEADLRGADLRGANLRGAAGGLLAIDGLPSGDVRLAPTPDGWALRVGCWGDGTATYGPDALRDLIAGTDWPQARGAEQDRRRPGLAALADLCDAHIGMWPNLVPGLAEKWGATA